MLSHRGSIIFIGAIIFIIGFIGIQLPLHAETVKGQVLFVQGDGKSIVVEPFAHTSTEPTVKLWAAPLAGNEIPALKWLEAGDEVRVEVSRTAGFWEIESLEKIEAGQ